MRIIPWWGRACDELSARDPVMTSLVERHRSEQLRGSGDAFRTLINAIVGQQISVAAADAIWRRMLSAYPGFVPRILAEAPADRLRSLGLSNQKADYVRGIARAFVDGTVDPDSWHGKTDEQVHAELTGLRGVGPWTADMVLIFHLHRPDVLPLGDIGLVNAAARLYGIDAAGESFSAKPTPKPMTPRALQEARTAWLREHAERWRPWRTVATWYIWRDLDAEPVVY